MKGKQLLVAASIAAIGLFPLLFPLPRWIYMFTLAFYYIIMASSWNVIMGFTGLFSFAHTALAAIGGYTSVLLALHLGLTPWLGLLAAGIFAALFSLFLGMLCLRLHGFYLCLVTWAFAEIAAGVLKVEYKWSGGTMGLTAPGLFPRGQQLLPNYYLGLVLAVLCVVFAWAIYRSRIGLYLRSLRDDPLASEALGVDTTFWKVFSFTVCGFWAGVGGAFFGNFIGVVDPSMGSLSNMGMVILMVIMGGIGTIHGPILGALFVVALSEVLRGELAAMSVFIFAILMILTMRFFRGGFAEAIDALQRRRAHGGTLPRPG
ncbi:MAG: branched-chain amino acid ABC transporter permease [Bacillota bacterium]